MITVFSLTAYPAVSPALYSYENDKWELRFTGYYKNIVAYTEPTDFPVNILLGIPENPFFDLGEIKDPAHWDNLSRLRLKLEVHYLKDWSSELEVEQRGLAIRPDLQLGGFFSTGVNDVQWLDMDVEIYDETGYMATAFVDRAWIRWAPAWGEIILGRQAITWTVGRLWSPTDRFGPFLPFDIEQDEKSGVDAANIAVNLGDLAEFRVIYAPLEFREDDRIGARLMGTVYGFDAHLMGGYFEEDYVGGISLTHNLFGWVARVEYAYTHPLSNQDDRWTVIAGADGALPKNIYGIIEYMHQSAGESDSDRYFESMPLLLTSDVFALAQDYLGGVVRLTPWPEISFSGSAIVNLNDFSSFLGPQIKYEPIQNVAITVAANFFVPYLSGSEYGLFSNTYFASFKGYF